MSRTEQIEIERKYDVDETARVPDLAGVGPVFAATTEGAVSLRAVYFDTAEHLLLANRITLRRREGGHDAGWHLKLPAGLGSRREVHAPLGTDADEPVPAAVRDVVEVLLRGRPVHPTLVLDTIRTITNLVDADGDALAEVADDEVTATNPATTSVRAWREWEVELAADVTKADGEALFAAVGDAFERAGASASASKSKLARGLGDVPGLAAVGAGAGAGAGAGSGAGAIAPAPVRLDERTAAAFVVGSLSRLRDELLAVDPEVRDRAEDALHRFRTTLRRLRAVVGVFRGVLDDDTASHLGNLLRSAGRAAGPARDLDAALESVDDHAAAAPEGFVAQEALLRLRARIGEAQRDASADLDRLLGAPEYFELLDRLDALVVTEPTGERAGDPRVDFVTESLARERGRARKRLLHGVDAFASASTGSADSTAQLHRARKAVRRFRYAQEAARRDGLKGGGSPKKAERLQDSLGEVLEDRAAVRLYLEAAAAARRAEEDTFGYGVLAEIAAAPAVKAAKKLPKLAKEF